MNIQWRVNAADVATVKELLRTQRTNALVRSRIKNNCSRNKPPVTKNQFWQKMVSMRLTSQQNSSPDSPVGRFVQAVPFPLAYEVVCAAPNAKSFIAKTLREGNCTRFLGTIPDHLDRNLSLLEKGKWVETLAQCNRLTKRVPRNIEVEVARYIQDKFLGFGPKQSRNLLQALGLTRFEIPVDSRVTDWLNEFGFPVHLTATALADINYYNFVSDGIQQLCAKSGVFPCVFDAAVFALKDGDAWTDENAF